MRRLITLLVVTGSLAGAGSATAVVLPTGFTHTTQWSGLGNPTVIRFAADGRVLVASKSGIVNVFDSLDDPSPTVLADLRSKVHDYWDRGLLGMALDPRFTSDRPYVYVLYAYDQGRWGDGCPTPPGPTADGCVVSGRLSRLAADGSETVLIEDWCQQYPSHSVGSLEFGPDGQLYVSSGDGASFNWADYGQKGAPVNPCGDPPGTAGSTLSAITSQGGALRAQAFRRPAGQPVALGGSILRVNPDTGAASDDNPASASTDPNRRRIVAYGFRNPFRFTLHPDTGELWSGDVGWNGWEEINRTQNLAQVRNYGWPCYEGTPKLGAYDTLDNTSCETLYGEGGATAPYFAYNHAERVVPGETCTTGSSSISGLHFYSGAAFGPAYDGALFFGDFSRNCIWVAYKDGDGLPDMRTRQTFAAQADGPVWLAQGPDGALYYADLVGGRIQRIAASNSAPTARISATPTTGVVPLAVTFDGGGSTDPEGRALTYAWDLDGDGAYDDAATARASYTYRSPATVAVRLRVTDPAGKTGSATQTITAGAPPTVTIGSPSPAATWAVGDAISFSGSARNSAGGALAASRLTWSLALRHCSRTDPTVCHTHALQDFAGVASGRFVAPDHEYPSHLQLSLTAVDAAGLSATRTVRLDPRTAELELRTEPAGLELTLGSETRPAPFTRTVLAKSQNTVGAASPQLLDGLPHAFTSWAGGPSPTGIVLAPASGSATYTAHFTAASAPAPTPTEPPDTPAPPADATPPPVVPPAAPTPELLGAWGFDTGANRVAGRHGKALRLDGKTRFVVRAPHLATFTVEAWAYATRAGTVAQRGDAFRLPTAARARWTHLALTYDGTAVRTYRDGTLVGATRARLPATTRPLTFGAFAGRLDDIRVYDGALTATQIAADRRAPVR